MRDLLSPTRTNVVRQTGRPLWGSLDGVDQQLRGSLRANETLQGFPFASQSGLWGFKNLHPAFSSNILRLTIYMYTRARWDWPQRPKFQNWDLHTWISIGNWILNLICFLQFFDLSTPFAVLLRFYFLPFLHGKNAQNRPENQQNWNLAKIGLKSDIFMK